MCRGKVSERRRGLCWGCYRRWSESRPVGIGASCTFCGDQRRVNLKSVELLEVFVAACHNCAARATSLSPMPDSLNEVRERLRRERRLSVERRLSKRGLPDGQRNRRSAQRRRKSGTALRTDAVTVVDDDMIIGETLLSEALPRPSDIAEETTDVRF